MDISWIRDLPLWIKAAAVLAFVVALLLFVQWRRSKKPASRGTGSWPFGDDRP